MNESLTDSFVRSIFCSRPETSLLLFMSAPYSVEFGGAEKPVHQRVSPTLAAQVFKNINSRSPSI